MVYAQNINSGQSNFQLGTRSSGSRRNLGYLLNRTLSIFDGADDEPRSLRSDPPPGRAGAEGEGGESLE